MDAIEIDGREVVKLKEIIQFILDRSFLLKDNFYKTNIIDFFLENNIEFISKDDERNPYKKHSHLFFVDSVSIVEQIIIEKIEICNAGDSEFKITKDDFLDSKNFKDKFYTCDEISIMFATSSPILFGSSISGVKKARRFIRRYCKKFNYIKLDKNIYFTKREIDRKIQNLSEVTTLEDKKVILNKQNVDGREVVKLKEMARLILESGYFLRENFMKTNLVDFFLENNIEFLNIKDERNPYKNFAQAFFIDSIPLVEQRMIDSIQIYNNGDSTFNITRDSLSSEIIMNEFYSSKEAGIILGNSLPNLFGIGNNNKRFEENAQKFMRRNCGKFNYIKIANGFNFSKREINQMAGKLSQLMSSRDAMKIVNERLDLNIKYRTFSFVVEKEGFVSDMNIPFKSDWFLINKNDIDDIVSHFDTKDRFNNAETAYGKLKISLGSMEKIENNKISETLKYFDSYCLEKSNKSKMMNVINKATVYKGVYMAITSRLTKELYELSAQEIEELMKYAERYSQEIVKELRLVYNYIVEKKNMPEKVLPISRDKTNEILAYPLETYFEVLAKLTNKLHDKTFIESLIGNRTVSSLALYIYTHYISVWRRQDIIIDLPKPNLKLIGFDTGIEFLEWLKAGNIFTEQMGRIICEDVQEKIYIYRETADKNDGDLLLYVSEYVQYIRYIISYM